MAHSALLIQCYQQALHLRHTAKSECLCEYNTKIWMCIPGCIHGSGSVFPHRVQIYHNPDYDNAESVEANELHTSKQKAASQVQQAALAFEKDYKYQRADAQRGILFQPDLKGTLNVSISEKTSDKNRDLTISHCYHFRNILRRPY